MSYKSNRGEDQRLEQLVNMFLDQYLFNKTNTNFDRVEWVTDLERQLKGADITLTSQELDLEDVVVDIKSAVKYSNKYLGTYALELSFLNRKGEENEGWLTNKEKNTKYYLLLYPKSKKYYTEMQTVDDIDSIEYYLVKRDRILSFLEGYGYDADGLRKVVSEMREDYDGRSKNLIVETKDNTFDFFFCLTGYLAEQPINIVIKRRVYDRLCKQHGIITREKHTIL